MNNQYEYIESLFAQLDGKYVYVKGNGLSVEGNLESTVKLKYRKHCGLILLSTLENNWEKKLIHSFVQELINPIVTNSNKIDFELKDEIEVAFDNFINNQLIQFGKLSPYNCKEVLVTFNEEKIDIVKIGYEKGLVEIRIVKN